MRGLEVVPRALASLAGRTIAVGRVGALAVRLGRPFYFSQV